MKGCLVLQRRFAYVGHAVARTLKERYGVSEFCGYVYQRTGYDFLKRQTDIAYGTLLLDSEVHERFREEKLDRTYLETLEKKYGLPSLWPYLSVDRVLMSGQLVREYPHDTCDYTHEELLRLLQVHAKAIEEMLDRERPDFLFCSVVGGLGSFLLFHICKKRGIRIVLLTTGCLRDRWLLSKTYDSLSFTDELFTKRRSSLAGTPARTEAETFLRTFRERPVAYIKTTAPQSQPVTRRGQFKFLNPKKGWKSFSTWMSQVVRSFGDPGRTEYDYIGPWNYLRDLMKRKARNLVGADDLYDAFDPSVDFAFFPLHYEPEVSLLLQAPYQTDQAHLILQIAKSLPAQMTLYVKDHPVMVEYRPRSFYRKLKKMPNVKLIPPTVDSRDILPHAKLITTITGTAGWEGTFLKKPVITFGNWFYNSLSFVRCCKTIEELPRLVQAQLNDFRYDENELLDFLAAIYAESFELDLQAVWNRPEDPDGQKKTLEPVAKAVAAKLGLEYGSST